MFGHIGGLKLSIDEFLEAMGDDNRFFTSRALQKSFADCNVTDLLTHYIANTHQPRTVHTFHVDHLEPHGFIGNPSEQL
jgi:hypothetical protein